MDIMPIKVDSYKTVTSNNVAAFDDSVNRLLREGWELYGEPRVIYNTSTGYMDCSQTLVGRSKS